MIFFILFAALQTTVCQADRNHQFLKKDQLWTELDNRRSQFYDVAISTKKKDEGFFLDRQKQIQLNEAATRKKSGLFPIETPKNSLQHKVTTIYEEKKSRHLSVSHGSMFNALSCNDEINDVACSSLSEHAYSESQDNSTLHIPCGMCFRWDHNQTLNIPGGLNIEGKLYVPSNATGTLRTTFIFLQGVLLVDPPNDGNEVKFLLYGEEERYLMPHTENVHACDTNEGCPVGKKSVVVAGGKLDIQGLSKPDCCPSWVKLREIMVDNLDVIDVGDFAANCWKIGDEILITSPHQDFERRTLSTIESITWKGHLVLSQPLPSYFLEATMAASQNFPSIVARLTRSVVLEAENDDSTNDGLHGGHLMIFHTPSIRQKIEGIEVRNFGQQGNLGRYPIHFHMSGDVAGSVVSKNVVRNSNQRGVVIHGTHNVIIEDNVAFEVFGHCFFTEDGIETGNKFIKNLGASIRKPVYVIAGENDNHPSVFWITNPQNHWIGNVAAGSDSSGFWFDTRKKVRGPSLPGNEEYSPRSLTIGSFRNNVAHSNKGSGIILYSPGWQPKIMSLLENSLVYRNKNSGFFLHGNTNIAIEGGILADNKRGILSFRASNIRLRDIGFVLHSEDYERVLAKGSFPPFCDGKAIYGMSIHPWRFSPSITQVGVEARGLHFRSFGDMQGCNRQDMVAVIMSTSQVQSFYDTPNIFQNISFEGELNHVSACEAAKQEDIDNISFEDVDGSFGPTGKAGFFVSNNSAMIDMIGSSSCQPVPDSCLGFCENSCIRQCSFRANNAYSTNGTVLVISNDTHRIKSGWHHQFLLGQTEHSTLASLNGKFGAALPIGHYYVQFEDSNGAPFWPDYVELQYEASPACGDFLPTFEFIRPEPTLERCTDLVKGGSFESGHFNAWQQKSCHLELASPGATNSTYALLVSNRDNSHDSVSQFIDISCLRMGDLYEFKALIRLRVDQEDVSCEPLGGNCPIVKLTIGHWDESTKLLEEKDATIAKVASSIKTNGWYNVKGVFLVSEYEAMASRAKFSIQQPATVDYLLDNVEIKKFSWPQVIEETFVDNVVNNEVIKAFGGSYVDGEGPENLMDGLGSKFGIFADQNKSVGFEVVGTLSACNIVTGLRVYTADKKANRDPASFVLEGRKSTTGAYQVIDEGALSLPSGRNAQGSTIGKDSSYHEYVGFANNVSYVQYRLIFPTAKDGGRRIHVGEVELPGRLC